MECYIQSHSFEAHMKSILENLCHCCSNKFSNFTRQFFHAPIWIRYLMLTYVLNKGSFLITVWNSILFKFSFTPYLSAFSPNVGKCGENADQNNSEYGRIWRRVYFLFSQYSILISDRSHMTSAEVFPKTRSLLPLSENARIFLTSSPPEVRYYLHLSLCIY